MSLTRSQARPTHRLFPALACVALAIFAGGCMDATVHYLVYPDGSGQATIEMIMGKSMSTEILASKGGELPSIEEMGDGEELIEGLDLISEQSVSLTEDGRVSLRQVGYFSDISKVEIFGSDASPSGPDEVRYATWTKTEDGGYVFLLEGEEQEEVVEEGDDEMGGDEEDSAMKEFEEQMKAMMKQMLAGLRFEILLTMPGAITDAKMLQAQGEGGRTASFVMDEEMLGKVMDEDEAWLEEHFGGDPSGQDMTVTCAKPGEEIAAEFEAFKAEWEAAKAKAASPAPESEDDAEPQEEDPGEDG